jgi:hypothetical protein
MSQSGRKAAPVVPNEISNSAQRGRLEPTVAKVSIRPSTTAGHSLRLIIAMAAKATPDAAHTAVPAPGITDHRRPKTAVAQYAIATAAKARMYFLLGI